MNEAPYSTAQLRESVIAVPPLARDSNLQVCPTENAKIIRFLESGGVQSLLYGGNAVLYHARLSEYAGLLQMLVDSTAESTVVVPSIGPAFGFAMDQVDVLSAFAFPTVMLLPARDVVDQAGIARGIQLLADRLAKPIVLYLKFDRWLDPSLIRSLEDDGTISWIKYAVVREDPSQDEYLREVLDVFPAERVVSGIGEQPAITHLRDFSLASFTSGCVCIAPERSMQMLRAIQNQQYDEAESIRQWFEPLEDLRNQYSPIRVLHHAVALASIAQTGPLIPMLSDLPKEIVDEIRASIEV